MKRPTPLNYHQVELLYAVVKTGGVTAAAKALHISQPAVTKQLRVLEETLGMRFFLREKGRLIPTAEALLMTDQIERTHASMAALGDLANRLRSGSGGRISLCAFPAVADRLLPRVVSLFQQQYPEVLVDIAVENTTRMLDLVESQQVDIAICAAFRTTRQISEAPLLTSRLLLAVSPDDELAHLSHVNLKRLNGGMLTVVEALEAIPQLKEALRVSKLDTQISARVSSSSFACNLALLNGARAIVDSVTAASFQTTSLRFLELPELPRREIALLQPLMRSSSEFVARFCEILKAQALDSDFNLPLISR